MGIYRWLAERDQIPSGTLVKRRAWSHRHPVLLLAGWTAVMGTFFAALVWPAGWPMVAMTYGISFIGGLWFQRSTERLYRADQRRSRQDN